MQPTVAVKFEYSSIYSDKLFFQPLFFLAMNQKQQIFKQMNKPYNEEMLDNNLLYTSVPSEAPQLNLELSNSTINIKDFNLNYILDRYACDNKFTYAGAEFHLKIDNLVQKCPFKTGHDEHTITSRYEIIFKPDDFPIFEDLLKASQDYFLKFSDGNKADKNRLKMYLNSEEGNYFESVGLRAKRDLDSVFLPKQQKKEIIEVIQRFIDPETVKCYKELGINHKLTIMLEGVPGTGKSSLITALASHFNFNIALVSFTPKMTDVGFMRAMRSWSRIADKEDNDNKNRDTILVIEDMDCIFKERKSNDESRNMVTFSGILNALDGITTGENQIVFLTTNYIEHLDPALIRPGRVDYVMRFGYATKEQIKEIFTVYTKRDADANTAAKCDAETFYDSVRELNIKITTSLLQQYLLKYVHNTKLIMENVDEIKKMYDACNIPRAASESQLYN